MLPLFVTAKIQKISKNAQLYYQKVVNLPFFVTAKLKRSFFPMIYKQKVVVYHFSSLSPFLVPNQMTQMSSWEIVYPRIISPKPFSSHNRKSVLSHVVVERLGGGKAKVCCVLLMKVNGG